MSRESLIDWLLQAKTPSIRYLTSVNLLKLANDDPQVLAFQDEVHRNGPVPAILSQQTGSGGWREDRSYYTPKYTSSHWSMLLLAELAADPSDPRLRLGAEYMLEASLNRPQPWLEEAEGEIACFWANLLRYGLHAGIPDGPALRAVVGILVDSATRMGWRCRYSYDHPCAWGAGRALWAMAALPAEMRSPAVDSAIHSGLAFLLEEHSLVEADYPAHKDGKPHSMWSRLNFPLFYQADIMLVLRALAELGELKQPEAGPALEWLRERRSSTGRWRGASPYRQRTWALGEREETDRWVSLQAATVLAQA